MLINEVLEKSGEDLVLMDRLDLIQAKKMIKQMHDNMIGGYFSQDITTKKILDVNFL